MFSSPLQSSRSSRPGVSAVELAILLPFLSFLFVIGVDWARLFYYSVIVTNCARNGALYASDPYSVSSSPYASTSAASLADASNLTPAPTITSATGSDAHGPYVEVTVSYTFQTVTNFPGVPRDTTLVRMVRMSVAQKLPN